MNIVVIIPARNPDERLIALADRLMDCSLPVVVVDDGSDEGSGPVFAKLGETPGCQVLVHMSNRGKGAALKTAIAHVRQVYGDSAGCVTADADLQHKPEDILSVVHTLRRHRDCMVLGTRDFGGPSVPFRSRWGNRMTAGIFRLVTGIRCGDTQTGLRGIPPFFLEECLLVEGNRFEYEMNVLLHAARAGIPFRTVPIDTVYEPGNPTSHYHSVRDSVRIFGSILKYTLASLLSAAVDLVCFAGLNAWLFKDLATGVFLSTVGARILSGGLNFMLNRNWVFRSCGHTAVQALQYSALFVCAMCISGLLVTLLASWGLHHVAAKIMIDTLLFLTNYTVQKAVVFPDSPQSRKG